MKEFESERLRILTCDFNILNAVINGDSHIAKLLNIQIPSQWTEYGSSAFQYVLTKITKNHDEEWWTHFPILKSENILIGSGGYKGKPDENGVIEIGYEIAKDYRNNGYATEFAKALLDHAFLHPEVHFVIAHTLAEQNASTHVLLNCGFTRVQVLDDAENETLWKWELKRPLGY
jgi:ribosomal-protein-alanine N-acetyltransferase